MAELLVQKPLETHVQKKEDEHGARIGERSCKDSKEQHKCLYALVCWFSVLLAITLNLLSRCMCVSVHVSVSRCLSPHCFFPSYLPHSYISALSGCSYSYLCVCICICILNCVCACSC